MDLLQRELARKKSVLQQQHGGPKTYSSNKTKTKKTYRKQSELRRLEEEREEEERRLRLEQQQQQQQKEAEEEAKRAEKRQREQDGEPTAATKKKKKKKRKTGEGAPTGDAGPGEPSGETAAPPPPREDPPAASTTTPAAVTQRLRALGLPVRFFGETEAERNGRLEQALKEQHKTLQGLSEMDEFRLGKGHGIRNHFLERDTKSPGKATEAPSSKGGHEEPQHRDHKDDEDEDDEEDPPKRIYRFLKGLLKSWEEDLEARSEAVARSVAGRNELKTLKQCKDYIRPLFKLLKQRKLEPGMQAHLTKIMEFAKEGEFVRAHDAYLDVAIGRAAWPIGVTMVGIHARSGRAKIESSKVAHVMNSELQRKYLTSVKRLLSYAQKKRTDVDPSKKVS